MPRSPAPFSTEAGRGMLGFVIFLLSESVVFLSFFVTYIVLRVTTPDWVPVGVSGPAASRLTLVNTIVLLASSGVIFSAEQALKRRHLARFRLLWCMTGGMGACFLVGQLLEWHQLDFGLTTGLMGGTFYLLTGFHGLHVFAGLCLQLVMLVRSFQPGNYRSGHWGVNATALFWHFVDGIWIILFALLYLWRA